MQSYLELWRSSESARPSQRLARVIGPGRPPALYCAPAARLGSGSDRPESSPSGERNLRVLPAWARSTSMLCLRVGSPSLLLALQWRRSRGFAVDGYLAPSSASVGPGWAEPERLRHWTVTAGFPRLGSIGGGRRRRFGGVASTSVAIFACRVWLWVLWDDRNGCSGPQSRSRLSESAQAGSVAEIANPCRHLSQ